MDWDTISTIGGGVLFVGSLVVVGWRMGIMEGRYIGKKDFETQKEKCKMDRDTEDAKFNKKLEKVENKIDRSNHEIHQRIDLVLEAIKDLSIKVAEIGK